MVVTHADLEQTAAVMFARVGWLLSLGLALSACEKGAETTSVPADEPAAAAAPSDAAIPDGPYPDRDPELAHRLVEQHGAVLLDVRTPEEFEGEHVDGAHNIPHDTVADQAAQIETLTGGDKSTPIVVYCRSGGRAGVAKKALLELGYERVTNVGGLSDW